MIFEYFATIQDITPGEVSTLVRISVEHHGKLYQETVPVTGKFDFEKGSRVRVDVRDGTLDGVCEGHSIDKMYDLSKRCVFDSNVHKHP